MAANYLPCNGCEGAERLRRVLAGWGDCGGRLGGDGYGDGAGFGGEVLGLGGRETS